MRVGTGLSPGPRQESVLPCEAGRLGHILLRGTGSLPGRKKQEEAAQIPNILFITCLIQRRNYVQEAGLSGEGPPCLGAP